MTQEEVTAGTLWTVAEVAAYLKTSRSWVYGRIAIDLPCFRVGGLLRFDPAAVRGWVQRQQMPGATVVTLKGVR